MALRSLKPIIKWSGSKRMLAPSLAPYLVPCEHFIDPFVGGGAILPWHKSVDATAGDIIPELVELWRLIQKQPAQVAKEYTARWQRRQAEGYEVYYQIRDSFNQKRNPHDLLFLSRTCVNGLIRFNSAGQFNNSLHHTRPGIDPQRLAQIVNDWSDAIKKVRFVTGDYRETLRAAKKGALVFLDPPYAGTKGRYQPGVFDTGDFVAELERLNKIGARWILTFDGAAGERTYKEVIPSDLYVRKTQIGNGTSPFTRVMDKQLDHVTESIYLNFKP